MIIVVSGPGGAGKGSVVSALVDRDPRLWLSRSWTTRVRRPGEAEDAYVFVDRPAFEARIADGGFLEWAEFLGHLYGTPVPEAPPGRDLVLEIELQGAAQVRRRHPDALCFLVVAPSAAEQERRLRSRGDDEAHVRVRLDKSAQEADLGRELADHVIVNDDLGRAVEEMAALIDARRGR